MKLQGLAILFVILILPLSIIIGEYASFQIETFRLERLYDSRLITATHDAIKTYQINTFNDELSDIVNNKLETIEASATTFYNSLRSGFAMQGYTAEELQQYVPALVYTMYDGYYIYSPYTDVAGIKKKNDKEGNPVDTLINKLEEPEESEMVYGFKPYVYYSCEYIDNDNDNDFVINYTLDNYITISGMVNGEYVNKSGHLVTLANSKGEEGLYREYDSNTGIYTFYYSGEAILPEEAFQDDLVIQEGENKPTTKKYQYIKINGEKYYYEPAGNTDGDDKPDRYFFHLVGGNRVIQVGEHSSEFYKYMSQMELNRSAISYYRNAYEFTTWVNSKLGSIKPEDAQASDAVKNTGAGEIFKNPQIEYSNSNFNLHRKEVIRYSIESNLSIAIANYNKYSNAGANVNFQMPKLKETEWEMLENEISVISFLQGLNIGGKIYNGYTVVTNNKNEEFVDEESIYITTNDGYYNKINDKNFENVEFANKAQQGVLDLDFEKRRDGKTKEYYIPKKGLASYSSVVGQEKLNTKYDTIYEYLQKTNIQGNVKNIYYTALARERWASFKLENPSQVPPILDKMPAVYDYLPITDQEKTTNGEGIITDGLIRYYDALNVDGKKNISITQDGVTSKLMTKWKDLSGHYDGIMMDGVFGDMRPDNGLNVYSNGYVNFEGVDHSKEEHEREAEGDWVNVGQIKDLKNVTLETVFSLNDSNQNHTIPGEYLPGVNYYLISNKSGNGGMSLYVNRASHICFSIQVTGGEKELELNNITINKDHIYHVLAVYNGSKMSIYLKDKTTNGEIIEVHKNVTGISINNPTMDTAMALGVDPQGNDGTATNWGWANIKMYTARIYSKALTDGSEGTVNQIKQNIDGTKIGITNTIPATPKIQISDEGATSEWISATQESTLHAVISVEEEATGVGIESVEYVFSNTAETPESGWISLNTASFTSGRATAKEEVIKTLTQAEDAGKWYIHVRAKSPTGGIKNAKTVIGEIVADFTNPVIQFSSQGSSEIWKKDEQSLIVTVSDADAGLSELMYKWTGTGGGPITGNEYAFFADGGEAFSSGEEIKIQDEGKWILWIYAKDNAGNVAIDRTDFTFNVDKTIPEITFTPDGIPVWIGSKEINIKATDIGGSDISKLTYKWASGTELNNSPIPGDEEAFFADGTTVNASEVTITTPSAGGEHYLWVQAYDKAGNVIRRRTTYSFKIDDEGPQIAITPNGGSTASSYNVTITVTDDKSTINNSTLMYRIAKPGIVPEGSTIRDPKNKEFFSGINGGNQFSNGQTVQIQGTSGNQYILWVYAEDINGNCITNFSSVFTIK